MQQPAGVRHNSLDRVEYSLPLAFELTPTPRFDKLRVRNYPAWKGNISATLKTRGWWRIVQGTEKRLDYKDAKAPTAEEEKKARDDWEDKALRAAGEIYLSCSDD